MSKDIVLPTLAWRLRGHDGCSPSRCHCVPPLSVMIVEAACVRGEASQWMLETARELDDNVIVPELVAVADAYRGSNSLRSVIVHLVVCLCLIGVHGVVLKTDRPHFWQIEGLCGLSNAIDLFGCVSCCAVAY